MRALRWMARHRLGGLAAVSLALAIGVVVVLVLVASSPAPTTASGAAKAPAGAATVRRRNLVATDTESGTLSYANPQTVYDRLSGTITWLPSVGQVIKPGATLLRVNGAPVTLMDGSTPAYRTLSSADSDGTDILELNRNLAALGFNANGIVVDDEWQEATTLGVELLQESLGESPTGSLALGAVVFLPGPQLVSTVDGTVGDTANGGGSGTPASLSVAPAAPQFVTLTAPGASLTTTSSTTTATTQAPPSHKSVTHKKRKHPPPAPSLAVLLALLKAQSAQLRAETEQLKAAQSQSQNSHGGAPSKGASSGSGGTGKGSGGGSGGAGSGSGSGAGSGSGSSEGTSGTAVLQTTSTHLVVTVDLDASLQSEAKVGERVTVELPSGRTVNGRVSAVSPVAQSSDSGSGSGAAAGGAGGGGGGGGGGAGAGGGSGSSTIPVTITVSGHHLGSGLDEAAVSVSFVQQRARHVLSVPVTALVAVSGGNYALQEAAAPHTLIPVTVGLFAAGYVQVSGAGVYPGLQVTDSQG
ncbi:MAG TPA: hypothetical protein VMF14_13515 [Solirubrobacteraceae bacterium]|nr:hypothetical protein [Solirubrobacteraceae bacterium]